MGSIDCQTVTVGDKKLDFFKIDLPKSPLLLLKGEKGFIMCGYLDISVADKVGDSAAKVRGVKDIKDFLEAQITEVTKQGHDLGLRVSMKVRDALPLLS